MRNKMKKIGVIVAFNEEIGRLGDHGDVETVAGVPFTRVLFGSNEAVIALCGIGKENAAACAQLLVTGFGCGCVLNIGLAGSACELPIGGAVVVRKAVYHDMNMSFVAEAYPYKESFFSDEEMRELAVKVLVKRAVPFLMGDLATGDIFVSDSAVKKDIIERTGCSAIEMEGAAIAHICAKNDIPCCLVKIISDTAEVGASAEFRATLDVADYLNLATGFIREFCEAL